ncbi:penicillin-binding protein 2 [Heliorestis acidaminivorans]|uniref:Penicillin-binding protein 2 n=1 Tax=Heliorestis acidaminivorans TaxID=553427 RepID=A0A6I0F522_9FIRM|nr:penicillin-binding protein 2 [Heliorestis acidaminivorans]KAB2952337.1 penicillin-binding protein 2 [Heliorestis acidaminivorans]
MSKNFVDLSNKTISELPKESPAVKRRKELEKTLRIFAVITMVLFVFLFSRLFYLQLMASDDYQTTSERNRLRLLPITAMRGDIVDINGVTLATSVPVYSVSITHLDARYKETEEEVVEKVASILGQNDPRITPEYIKDQINKSRSRLYEPILIKSGLTEEEVAILEEKRYELPGVVVEKGPVRYYPTYGDRQIAGHLLGYVREISRDEMERFAEDNYRLGDMIGKIGLERAFEKYLRGQDGFQQVEVNAFNRPIQSFYTQNPTPGQQIALTIDAEIQNRMEEAMDETLERLQNTFPKAQAGAAALIDVRSGAILAMVSRPNLDPNDFIGLMDQATADYYHNSNPPAFINRVFQSAYPPGSTFKPITALAALAAGRLNPSETVNCTGAYWEKPYIRCTGVHGAVDLVRAMATSCNVYFQEMGRRATIDNVSLVAREFGLGEETGINLPGEEIGLMPGRDWKRAWGNSYALNRQKTRLKELEKQTEEQLALVQMEEEREQILEKDERIRKIIERDYQNDLNYWPFWQAFETYNTSIGQGRNQYTVLQLANYVATLANGGTRYEPYLVDRIERENGEVVHRFEPTVMHRVSSTSAEEMAAVRRSMLAVTEPRGTAYHIFHDFPVRVAGKTGTAETGRVGDSNQNRDFHGVFVAFAPYDNPEVAFAGVIEYGYHGGSSAGMVAKAVFEEYFGFNQRE